MTESTAKVYYYSVHLTVAGKTLHSELVKVIDEVNFIEANGHNKVMHDLSTLVFQILYARDSMSASNPIAVFREMARDAKKALDHTVHLTEACNEVSEVFYTKQKTHKTLSHGYVFDNVFKTSICGWLLNYK